MGTQFHRIRVIPRDPITGEEIVDPEDRDTVLQLAIRDPRWKNDPQYQAQVMAWMRWAEGYDQQQAAQKLQQVAAGAQSYGMKEMLEDMAKPEYKTDPAFRTKVQEKLAQAHAQEKVQAAAQAESAAEAAGR